MNIKREMVVTGIIAAIVLGFALLNKGHDYPQAYAAGEESFDTHEVSLSKSELGLTSQSNKAFNVTQSYVSSSFGYSGTSNLVQTSLGFYSIKTKEAEALKQSTAAGSAINKWVITKLVFEYTKVSTATGNLDVSLSTNVGTKTAFSFAVATNSTSVANLNANVATQTVNYDFSENIQTFTLIVSKIMYISNLTITYSIDYSIC